MTRNLQSRYTLAILALVVLLIGGASSLLITGFRWSINEITDVSVRSTTDELLDQLLERGLALGETLALNLANPFYDLDMEQMERLLSTILRQQDVVMAVAVDMEGKIVHDGSELIPGYGEELGQSTVDTALASGRVATAFDTEAVHLATPMKFAGETAGALYLEFSRASTQERIATRTAELAALSHRGLRRSLITALTSGVLMMGVGFYIAHLLARSLTGPIYLLAARAREIGRGEYAGRLDVERRDELGELARAFNEMSEDLRRGHEAIRHMAYHDSLTSLPNRAHFEELLNEAVEARSVDREQGALMFVDLDHFKHINDTLGHKAGDDLLIEVARRLTDVLRAHDAELRSTVEPSQLARQGGDEFTVLLPRIHEEAVARHVAQRMLERLEEPCTLDGRSVVVSASIGIAIFPQHADSATELLKRADMALYRAKELGRNAYHLFDGDMSDAALERLDLEQDLRRALQEDELELFYQPLYDARGERVVGAEALLRWRHGTRGLVSPAAFIPVAESSGLIVPIGRWVLQRACEDAALWRRQGLADVDVSVNVSAVQLRRPELEAEVVTALRHSGLPAEALHLEVTESSLVKNDRAAADVLGRLSPLGVRIWMDDFGTGHASLGYLRRFPFKGVKIDASFVIGMADNAENLAIVHAIVAMCRSLGLEIVAEGVETESDAALLRRVRCDRLQGYLYARPMPLEGFLEHCGEAVMPLTGTDGI